MSTDSCLERIRDASLCANMINLRKLVEKRRMAYYSARYAANGNDKIPFTIDMMLSAYNDACATYYYDGVYNGAFKKMFIPEIKGFSKEVMERVDKFYYLQQFINEFVNKKETQDGQQ